MNKKDFYLANLSLATTSIAIFTSLSASAFTISSGKISHITAEDLNKSFTIRFDGIVDGQDVFGLSSQANLQLTRFTTSEQETIAAFDVLLKNTSSHGIKSRLSVFGFNTDAAIKSSSSEGFFSNTVLDGSLPHHLGHADVCFNSGGNTRNCRYSYGGVRNKHSELFSLEIIFDPEVTEFELADFMVRHQGIKGLDWGRKGVGFGSITEVPEPSTNAALALLTFGSLGWLAKKRKQLS
ncbi:MAG: cistern family PEP-CTERM protein [Xenococcaceae cyanobacterium MO_188.B29]|nr:cistern family PEP-CTERM protein [Xenococcaceae cyanobacterium MO_188.B29]